MGYHEIVTRTYVEGEMRDEGFESFDSEKDALSAFESVREGLVDGLHDVIVSEARAAAGPDGCSYGGDTFIEAELKRGPEGAAGGETVDSARTDANEVFARFGRTGGAWKVEVVLRDRDDEVVDLLDDFTVYPGGDWSGLAREALASCARDADGKPGAVLAELYVTAYVEVDDDGGDGEGEIVLHEAVEL